MPSLPVEDDSGSIHTCRASGRWRVSLLAPLTRQQQHALLWVYREGGEPNDCFLRFETGVRPWPTLANLARKGLVEIVRWEEINGDEYGFCWRLTDDGKRLADALERVK